METAAEPGIQLDERGVAWIEGTRTKVIEIVRCQQAGGYTPEEIHLELPHITLSQVKSVLAYYGSHQEELDADMARRDRWVEEFRKSQPEGPTREDLLKRLRQTNEQ